MQAKLVSSHFRHKRLQLMPYFPVCEDMTVEGNEGDRNDLKLWHGGEDLVKTVAKECSNTIVIIHSPGPADIESFADSKNVTAIIAAGQPGQESGNAITDVLFGKVNPSGRLPYVSLDFLSVKCDCSRKHCDSRAR